MVNIFVQAFPGLAPEIQTKVRRTKLDTRGGKKDKLNENRSKDVHDARDTTSTKRPPPNLMIPSLRSQMKNKSVEDRSREEIGAKKKKIWVPPGSSYGKNQ